MGPKDLHHPLADFLEAPVRHVLDDVTAQVRGHDDDGVAEVDGATLAVGQASVVEQLEQDVEDVGVCFLDFVEQYHRVRPAPDGLGQLAALAVADVAGWSPDEPCHGVAFLVFGHVETDQRLLVIEEELGQRPSELCLAHPGGTQEDEGANRPVGVGEARA